MEERDLLDLEHNRKKLISFIRAAEQGKYYRPMEAVTRLATIEEASTSLSEDSLLRALAQEVRDLRATVTATTEHRTVRPWREHRPTVKRLLRSAVFRKGLYPHFLASGGQPSNWPKVLQIQFSPEVAQEMSLWTGNEWRAFVEARAKEQIEALPGPLEITSEGVRVTIDDTLLDAVRQVTPPQPWPDGVHREIADKLNISTKVVSRCLGVLVERGIFMKQVDGQLFPNDIER